MWVRKIWVITNRHPVIVDSENPYSPYFDAGLIWGPIFGREWYMGFRYMLK